MAQISPEEVKHISDLSRIELNTEKTAKMSEELAKILDYISELEKAETEKVGKILQINALDNVTREDKIEKGLTVEKILQNAPQVEGNYFKVKQIFES